MITIRNKEEMEEYYVRQVNTYVIEDDVEFLFDVNVESNIRAYNIKAFNINAYNINANNINAYNSTAWDIRALNIKAYHIKALDIKANDIKAHNISAWNIEAFNIKANDILYFAVCFAYRNIECNSIKGRYPNAKHFVLDGELIIGGKKYDYDSK